MPTDITVLDHILVLNLDVHIWTARKKLTPSDLHGATLPPEELASLGSKKICDPQTLRVFGTLKARAVNLLDRHGVRFLGGWAIPEERAEHIRTELTAIRDAFQDATNNFLRQYDQAVADWIGQHPGWENLIGNAQVSADRIKNRFGFAWQMFRLAPPPDTSVHEGLRDEIHDLGTTLFGEVAKAATETWHRSFAGKDTVTRKALSPLRTIHEKLLGLRFMEPRVLPVADLIQTAFDQVPKRGPIEGATLLTLQGLVALLRDPGALVEHGQKVLDGHAASDLLERLVAPVEGHTVPAPEPTDDEPSIPMPPPAPEQHIDSHGLW